MFTHRPQRVWLASALIAAAAFFALPGAAPAAPSASEIAAQRRVLERAVGDYAAARKSAASLEASVAAASANLDGLIAEQQAAQQRLSSHVASTYRYGPMTFLEVITSSASFEDFATRWFLLTRINEQDATAIAEVKAARARSLAQARRLIDLQTKAAKELRTLARVTAAARAELSSSRAAYAAYLRRIAALNSTKTAAPAKRSPVYTTVRGTGAWRSAKASHYGSGSWGHRTADGTTIRSDSMIVAHKTLPFGTLVEFQYNGKRAVARVADRGPYVKGREWDLGPGVISVLGFNGVHMVKYRIIGR